MIRTTRIQPGSADLSGLDLDLGKNKRDRDFAGNNMIEAYSFGQMTIDGRAYKSDLIIYPDKTVQDKWWRQSGHVLTLADITSIIRTVPEVLIAGTGESGLMKPDANLARELASRDIEMIARPSREAVEVYNQLADSRRVAACFHLTC